MRYFKIKPHSNKIYTLPDGFSYCKVSETGRLYSWNYKDKCYFRTDRDSVKLESVGNKVYKIRECGLVLNFYYDIIEEYTKEGFENRLNSLTYLEELTS